VTRCLSEVWKVNHGQQVVSVVVLSLVFLVSPPAHATTLLDASVERLTRASERVIVGHVERVTVHAHGPGGQPGIHSRALVRVTETWRGEAEPFVEVWVQGGELGSRRRVVSGQARFSAGETVVLFLFSGGGALWPTGMGRGKWSADALRIEPPTAPLFTPTAGPANADASFSLDELRARVRSSQ